MKQLIDKSTLVAEIEKRRDESWLGIYTKEKGIIFDITDEILSFLDTLEVKEVDLEQEIRLVKGDYEQVDVAWNNDFDYIARHFYELGVKSMKGE